MGISNALVAFLEALDGSRTDTGRAPVVQAPQPVQSSPALAEIVTAHGVKLAQLEASVAGLKGFITEETDRATRASEATRRAVQRALARLEGGGGEPDPGDDVSTDDGGARQVHWVQPMPNRVEAAPLTPEQIREAARRAVAFT